MLRHADCMIVLFVPEGMWCADCLIVAVFGGILHAEYMLVYLNEMMLHSDCLIDCLGRNTACRLYGCGCFTKANGMPIVCLCFFFWRATWHADCRLSVCAFFPKVYAIRTC